jgi:hypothetical protein
MKTIIPITYLTIGAGLGFVPRPWNGQLMFFFASNSSGARRRSGLCRRRIPCRTHGDQASRAVKTVSRDVGPAEAAR